MDYEKISAWILVISGFYISVINPLLQLILSATEKKEDANITKQKTGLEIYESLTEDLQEERKELRLEIEAYKGERKVLIQGMADLESRVNSLEKQLEEKDKELIKTRRQFDIKEKSYLAAIDNLNDKINELEKIVQNVKATTDEIKRTGPLPQ